MDSESQKQNSAGYTPSRESNGTESNGKEAPSPDSEEELLGVLEVFIHQARDIHNICIYHKQDVYARLSFTSDPETTVSTKIINGGGRNPVFNETLKLNVRTFDTSLKCEIWMLSRVKNYLEDQLLGFALVPLSEVVVVNGKLEREFSLSSTDLFHSPAGFVQLSLSYDGAPPEIMAIPAITGSETNPGEKERPSDLDMIEFPDPKIANEDQIMVSEYFGIPCSEMAVPAAENSPIPNEDEKTSRASEADSPTDVVSSPALPESSSESSEARESSKSTGPEAIEENGEKDSIANPVMPVVSVTIEAEDKVVQQDIVDMYMKSMQEFTESLAKMKLPLDIESGPPSSGSSTSDPNVEPSKNGGSRVFYGSRAFF